MSKIYLLTKVDPHNRSWRGRSDADAVHVSAKSAAQAREIAAQLNDDSQFPWKQSPWLSELHAQCEIEYESLDFAERKIG